jgi:hypothetical protein
LGGCSVAGGTTEGRSYGHVAMHQAESVSGAQRRVYLRDRLAKVQRGTDLKRKRGESRVNQEEMSDAR